MKIDLLSLQALFVASGILVIWLFWRAKPWCTSLRRGAKDPAGKSVESPVVRKIEDPVL